MRAPKGGGPMPPPEAQLNPHADMQPFEVGGATYLSEVRPRGGGFTVWPGSHRILHGATEQEFIPSPTAEFASRLARIKAEVTPFEFVGDVGDVMIYHHLMVHSTGETASTARNISYISIKSIL
jgi:hypothetical protein